MNKKVVISWDEKAKKEFLELKKLVEAGTPSRKKPTYSQLLSSINNAIKNIELNHKYGDLIPRKYISKDTIRRYGTEKILRVELIGFWRLLYVIIGDKVKIVAFILEFMDHKRYNKIFHYKKR